MTTLEDIHIVNLRNNIIEGARSLKCRCKELLQRIRSVKLRNTEEYRDNCAERARLYGILDACIDYLAEEEREDSDGR